MGIFNKADAKGVAAQLVDDLTNGRKGASDRAVDAMVKGGVSRTEAHKRVTEGMRDALIEINRKRR
jgi:hypothetical protein